MSAKERAREVDNKTKEIISYDPGPPWQQTKNEINNRNTGYKLELYGNQEVTGERLPSPSAEQHFDNALMNSDVVIYIGHGAGDGDGTEGDPFKQLAIQIGTTYYQSDGKTDLVNNAQSANPDATASVVGNFSCDASSRGGTYFNFQGNNQTLVTLNSSKNGITSVGAVEKAAHAFVKTYVATNGNVQKAIAAANAVLRNSLKAAPQNKGDVVESKKVN